MRNHPETGMIAVEIDAMSEEDRRMWLARISEFAWRKMRGSAPPAEPARIENIHDDLAKVIDLEQRRAEMTPRGEP